MTTRLILRITAPIMGICLLLLAVGVGAAWQIDRWQKTVSQNLQANVSGIRAGEELEILIREVRTRLDHFLMTGDAMYLARAGELRKETERWLGKAERCGTTPLKQHLMAEARQGDQHFWNELDRITEQVPAAKRPEQVRSLIDNVLLGNFLDPAHKFLDQTEDDLQDSIEKNQYFADWLVYALLFLGTCGSAVGLVAGFGFARGLSRSLFQLSVLIRDAAGRLDVGVEPINFSAVELSQMENVLRLISERVSLIVDRLQRREREALHAEQLAAVGQLAAGMAHELRNPLTSIKMLVQGALADTARGADLSKRGDAGSVDGWASPGLTGRDLAVLEEEITRLEQLIQSFLDFARPPKPEKRIMDLRPLVDQTLALLSGRAAAASVKLEWIAPGQPLQAAIDPGQFRQVLLNLVLNALDALAGPGVITIVLDRLADGAVSLHVADNGIGLPAALGDRIFEPFATTRETGLGLGLSICKRIVEAHGGTIAAASRPEGGAVFSLKLPAAPPA